MPMLTHYMANWSKDHIAIVNHELYDLAHILNTDQFPTTSSKGVDVLRFNDDKEQNYYLQGEFHLHNDFTELVYIKSGSGMAAIDEQQYMIHKGDLLVIRPFQIHGNIPLPQLCVTNCLVSTALLHKRTGLFPHCIAHNDTLNLSPLIHLTGDTMLRVERLLEEMSSEIQNKPSYYQDAVQNKFNELLILVRRFEEGCTTSGLPKALSATINYISEHYNTVTLAEAAAVGHYNPAYFSRLFYNCMEQHFTEYVNKLRINKALFLLMTTDSAIEEISATVGFKSKIHFYDVFRKYTGMTPGSIRKSKNGRSAITDSSQAK